MSCERCGKECEDIPASPTTLCCWCAYSSGVPYDYDDFCDICAKENKLEDDENGGIK